MNKEDLIKYVENPALIDVDAVKDIESLIQEYPYFQIAHLLLVKGLHNINSIRYTGQLKQAACYAGDRSKLFTLIKTRTFSDNRQVDALIKEEKIEELTVKKVPEKEPAEERKPELKNDIVKDEVTQNKQVLADKILSRLNEIKEKQKETASSEEDLLDFDYSDSMQFTENKKQDDIIQPQIIDYLHATGIQTDNDAYFEVDQNSSEVLKDDNMLLIEKFLQKKPTIKPKPDFEPKPVSDISQDSVTDGEYLSETLADIYIKQKNFEKAMKIYQKLSLKYPQKSIYFADQISKIKELISNT